MDMALTSTVLCTGFQPTRVAKDVDSLWRCVALLSLSGCEPGRDPSVLQGLLADGRREAGRTGTGVVDAVRTRGGTAPLDRRTLVRRHPAGGDEEACVADHLVARADREPLDVPVPDERLPRLRLGEPAVCAEGLDHA